MKTDLTEKVREACCLVSDRSTMVRINLDRIPAYASSLPLDIIIHPELDPLRHYIGSEEDTASFFMILDAINFGSGYFPYLSKRPGMSGYFTIASSLTDFFREHGPLPAETLAFINPGICTDLFGQDPGNKPVQELMNFFSRALNDLGKYLLSSFNGSFAELIRAADSSSVNLMGLLIEMPYFKDVGSYPGLDVPFYKRAQLTAADLSVALKNSGLGYFEDLDRLTIFADNLVPHVLRVDGILSYDHSLLSRIDSGALVQAGSVEEIEIRACALHSVELIKNCLNESGESVTSHGLDYLLWNRGQLPFYKAIARHRSRTVYY